MFQNSMGRRILVNGLLTSGLQMIIYTLILYCFWGFKDQRKMDIIDLLFLGAAIKASLIYLSLMLIVTNVLSSIINKRDWTIGLVIVTALTCCTIWKVDFTFSSWDANILIMAALMVIFSKFIIEKSILRLIARYNS